MSEVFVPSPDDFVVPATEHLEAYAVDNAPDHLREIAIARREKRLSTELVFPSSRAALLPTDLGVIVTVFDRVDGGVGPEGFHRPLLDALLARGAGLVVIAHDPRHPDPYRWAIKAAIDHPGGVVMVVETRPQHEQAWLDLTRVSRTPENWYVWGPLARGAA